MRNALSTRLTIAIMALASIASAETYSVHRLNPLIPGIAAANAMNGKGQVAGSLEGSIGFIYSPGQPLITLPGLDPSKINSRGDVIGNTGTGTGFFRSRTGAIVMLATEPKGLNDLGQFIHQDGTTCVLRDESGIIRMMPNFGGSDITNSGRVAGSLRQLVGEFTYFRPRIWEPSGSLTVITEPFSTQSSTLKLINEKGRVLGSEFGVNPRSYWNSGGASSNAGAMHGLSLNEDGVGLGGVYQSGALPALLIRPGSALLVDPMIDGDGYWHTQIPICRTDDGRILTLANDPFAVPSWLILTPRNRFPSK